MAAAKTTRQVAAKLTLSNDRTRLHECPDFHKLVRARSPALRSVAQNNLVEKADSSLFGGPGHIGFAGSNLMTSKHCSMNGNNALAIVLSAC